MGIKRHTALLSLGTLFAPISAVTTMFNASFDDRQGSIESGLTPVGIYDDLSYTQFGIVQPGIDGESLSGVMPHSNPNFAVNRESGLGSVSIDYPGSVITSFGLNSFYYGCNTALDEPTVEVAATCSVTVTGFKAGFTNLAATQTFTFTPSQPVDLQNPPTFGTFSSEFQGLESANFSYSPSTLALIIDNLVGFVES